MSTRSEFRRLQSDLGELIAHHEAAQSLTDYSVYAEDPIGFIRDVLGADPWARQIEIIEAVRDCSLVAVRSCNSAGKDWTAAQIALWWVYCRNGLVLLTGPTERQVRVIVMGEVARAFARAGDLPGELFASALRLSRNGTTGILAFTSTEASKLTGFHAPRVLAILTEAQAVEDFAWEGLMACATGAEDRLLAVGNPMDPQGRFFRASRSPTWRAIGISAEEHPNIIKGETVIPGGVTREWVDRMASEFGRGSNTYTSRVLGEFPDQGDEGLFARSKLDAAVRLGGVSQSQAMDDGLVIAVDPARFGPDATAIAVTRGMVVTELEAWAGAVDLMTTADRVCAVLNRLNVRRADSKGVAAKVVVDSVGLGAGLADYLRRLGYYVIDFNGGERARQHERFLNRRAETYWYMREQIEAGHVGLPSDDYLIDELLSVRWRSTPDGKIRIEPKDEIKGRLGRSPDRADAVTMALGLKSYAPPAISREVLKKVNAGLRRKSYWGDMGLGPTWS